MGLENVSLLLEQFSELVRTPADVEKLNAAVLQWAVGGWLVEQDANNKPVVHLVERGNGTQEQTHNTKKVEWFAEVTSEEIPFDLPDSWVWLRMGNICLVERGITFPSSAKESTPNQDNIACLRTANVQKEVDWKNLIYVPREYAEKKSKLTQVGDILISLANSYELVGKVSFVDSVPIEATFGGFIAAIRCFNGIYPKFLFYCLRSDPIQLSLRGTASQTTNIANISLQGIYPTPIPIPPLEEQKRVVAKVEEIWAQTQMLSAEITRAEEKRQTARQAAVRQLVAAESPAELSTAWDFIAHHFHDLYTEPEAVQELKQAILELAVRGRLVEQDPNDEPAAVLLERIAAEKEALAKERKVAKPGKLSDELDSDIPYEIPNGWQWARFAQVANIASNLVQPGDFPHFPHVAPNNIEKGTGKLLDYRTVLEDDVQSANHRFFAGQLVYSKIRPNLSKVILAEFEGLCSADMYPIDSFIHAPYLLTFILSTQFLTQVIKHDTRVAMPKINQVELNKVWVAVPPLEEQERIVAKVNELFGLCDELEGKLTAAKTARERVLAAVLSQAV